MKISNFVLERTTGRSISDRKFFASVDVETGFLFWKKKERRGVCRQAGCYYFFTDTGNYCPGLEVDRLARAYTATTGVET